MFSHRSERALSGALCLASLTLSATACANVENPGGHNENEVITTVTLDFAADGAGTDVTASFNDPDGDGGQAPTLDPITLVNGAGYTLSVTFLNALEDPAEDLTLEVDEESDQHQLFFTGDAVRGPATGADADALVEHTYGDEDANGFPVGLVNGISGIATGTGDFIVTLRHLPPVDDIAVKTGTLAEDVASDGITALPGDTDASVTFELTVE